MYHHIKKLMYTVRVDQPDPKFGNMLLEQFGGANGELAAAMQYSIQGLNCEDPARKDLLMDIGTEELSHLEVVGTLARMHLAPMKRAREAAEADPLVAIAGGGGVCLFDSMGNAWTADYLKITGELDVDLRSNIAAEARAKIVYERLIQFCDDPGTKDALQFLMSREITHMKAFAAALESMGMPPFTIGRIPPTPGLVDQYFNDSTGEGDMGERDARGPWNEGADWEFVEAPAFKALRDGLTGERQPDGESGQAPRMRGGRATVATDMDANEADDSAGLLRENLVDLLSDLLSAENQLVQALPKLENAANDPELKAAFAEHLAETETHVERLQECLELLGEEPKQKTCRGMAGLVEEASEVIKEGEEKDPLAADMALVAAAQKTEHYEIAGYSSARQLASKAGLHEIAMLLGLTLAEEQKTDRVLEMLVRPMLEQAAFGFEGEPLADGDDDEDEADGEEE